MSGSSLSCQEKISYNDWWTIHYCLQNALVMPPDPSLFVVRVECVTHMHIVIPQQYNTGWIYGSLAETSV